ncbi:MAG: ABC transporter substrate-binding protein [Mycobacteriales bacterium]|nr:ABC transporter substrate-binding protein [Frankia sp.]
MRARHVLVSIATVAAVLATACGSGTNEPKTSGGSQSPAKGKVTIGAFGFAESSILAAMYEQVLDKAGYDASVKKLTNREVVEPALEKGELDVVPEYVGTLTEFLNKKQNKQPGGADPTALASGDLDMTLTALRGLATKAGLTVLTPAAAADQNAFGVTKKFATDNNLAKLSDLAAYRGKLQLGGPSECPKRPFCKPGLERVYGIHFTGFTSFGTDAGGPVTKNAIKNGKVQIGLVFSSDSSLDGFGIVTLEDDKHLQTVDNVVPVVRASVVGAEGQAALNSLAVMTTDELKALNKKVEVDHADAAAVAKEYLMSKGLL